MRTVLCAFTVFCLAVTSAARPSRLPEDKKPSSEPEAKPVLLHKHDQLASTDPFDTLPTANYRKVYEHKMLAGQKYALTLTAPYYTVFRLEDSKGQLAAPLTNYRQLVWTSPKTDVYRIIVTTTFRTTPSFTLLIREPDGKTFEKNDTLSADDHADKQPAYWYCKRYPHKLEKGETYALEMSSSVLTSRLRLEGPRGEEVAAGLGIKGTRNAQVLFTAPRSDTYTIVAASTGFPSFGAFKLRALHAGSKPGVASLDKEDSMADAPFDRVTTRSYRKQYAQKLQAGRGYVFELASTDFQPYLRLEDGEGNPLLQDGDARQARIVFTPSKEGTYRVIATSRQPDRTGTFSVKVSATSTEKDTGRLITDRFGPNDPVHRLPTAKYASTVLWKMLAKKPHVITVRGTGFTPVIHIEDGKGQFVASKEGDVDSLNARLSFTPADSGAYKIIVTSTADERTGPFALGIFTADPTAADRLATDGELDGKSSLDTITTRKRSKSYQVALTAGKLYEVTMNSTEVDSFLTLQDSKGQVLAQDDNGGEGNNSRIRFTPQKSEKYTIIATTAVPNQVGRFSLGATEIPSAPGAAPVFSKEDSLTDRDPFYVVRTQNHSKVHEHKMQEGQSYLIRLQSKEIDPYIRLETAEKEVLRESAGSARSPAELVFPCPTTGTYRIVASTTRKQQTGTFSLAVDGLNLAHSRKGQLVRGEERLTVPSAWRRKEFVQEFDAGKRYLVQVNGSDTVVAVEEVGGTKDPAEIPNSAHADFIPPRAGKYRILVLGKEVAPFTVLVRPLLGEPARSGMLTTTDPRDTQPTLRRCMVYTHRLAANQPYLVRASSTEFDPAVRVLDPKGNEVTSAVSKAGAGAMASVTPTVEGVYTIITAAQRAGEIGRFRTVVHPWLPTLEKEDTLTNTDPFDALPTGKTCKVYDYKVEAGRFYSLRLASKEFDAQLRLLDDRGQSAAFAQSSTGGPGTRLVSEINYAAGRTGTYRIIATAQSVGGYGPFQLTSHPFSTKMSKSESLTPKDPLDRLPTQKHRKAYPLDLQAGTPYFFKMASEKVGSHLRLEDAKGALVQQTFGGSPGNPAQLLFVPVQPGRYTLVATSLQPRETGNFTVTVSTPQTVASAAGKLTTEDFFDPLMNGSYQKVHSFKMKTGELYLISLQSKAFLPYLRLESSRGQHLRRYADFTRSGQAYIRFVALRDDNYRVIVTSSNFGKTGDYKVMISQPAPPKERDDPGKGEK